MPTSEIIRSDFNTVVIGVYLLVLSVLVAFISHNYRVFTKNILLANINPRVLAEKNRDESNQSRKANIWLSIFFLLSLGLLLFSLVKYLAVDHFKFQEYKLLTISIAVIVVGYLLKYGLKRFLGFVFKKEELTNIYFSQIGIKDKAFGILLFPLLILFTYSTPLKPFVFYFILTLLGIYLLIRWISGVQVGIKQGNLPYFFSILYICTLEIAPLAIIVKVFSMPLVNA